MGNIRAPPASHERPDAQRDDCLWLLTFVPDQVHRSPLRGPLMGGRRGYKWTLICTPLRLGRQRPLERPDCGALLSPCESWNPTSHLSGQRTQRAVAESKFFVGLILMLRLLRRMN